MRAIIPLLLAMAATALATPGRAQSSADAHVRLADGYYKQMAYAAAIPEYRAAADRGAVNEHVVKRLADSYMKVGDVENAEIWYAQVVKFLNREPRDLYNYAQALKGNAKYEQAEEWMDRYLAVTRPEGQAVRSNISDFARKFTHEMDRFTVRPVSINTPFSDMGTAWSGSRGVIFSSARNVTMGVKRTAAWNGQPFLDLFIADRTATGDLEAPHPLVGDVNTKLHEGPAVCSADQGTLWFTRNNRVRSQNGVSRLSLFQATRRGDAWVAPQPFLYNNTETSVGHPALSPDGRTLYFVSDMPGGAGGTDIYRCVQNGAQWSEPENLGPAVNTPHNECFPFVGADGTLYFASDGHPGLGGLDIFATPPPADGGALVAINVGAPVNGPRDDFAFIIDAQKQGGYFSSNRPGGAGDDDIYAFEMHKPLEQRYLCTGFVIDEEDEQPLIDVEVRLLDMQGNVLETTMTDAKGSYSFAVEKDREYRVVAGMKGRYDGEQHLSTENIEQQQILARDIHLVPDAGIFLRGVVSHAGRLGFIPGMSVSVVNLSSFFTETRTTGAGGDFLFRLQPNEEYEVLFEKTGFFSLSLPVSTIGMRQGVIDLEDAHDLAFEAVEVGRAVPFRHIKWAVGSAALDVVARTELDAFAERLQVNPALQIEIAVHSDARGDAAANQATTQKRADAIVDYLKGKGIERGRMTAKGYGSSRLLNHCAPGVACSEEEHAVNRRTEFVVTGIKP